MDASMMIYQLRRHSLHGELVAEDGPDHHGPGCSSLSRSVSQVQAHCRCTFPSAHHAVCSAIPFSVVSCLARQLGPLRPSIIRSLRGPLVLSEALLLLRFQADPRHALLIGLEVAESAVHKLRPSQAFQKRHCWLQAHLQRPKPPTNLKW